MASEKRVYQTLQRWARDQLDPRYCDLFDRVIQYLPPIEQSKEWHERLRSAPSGYEGMASDAVEVETRDIPRGTYWVRVYRCAHRERGKLYPGFVYAHGGGGVVGNIESDRPLCSQIALAGFVVIAVDYRLAPEHPHPDGVNDCFDAVRWVAEFGQKELDVDQRCILIGGSSTGANFAAVVALKARAHNPPIYLKMQILLVPSTIHTAARHRYREEAAGAPGASRIEWYQSLLYPNQEDTESPEASPLLASPSQLAGVPDTWIAVAGVDVLRGEGIAFAKALLEAGVQVRVREYEKIPHMLLQLDKLLELPVIDDIVEVMTTCVGLR